MTDITTETATTRRKAPRTWNRYAFYMSDRMAEAAHRLSEAEEERTGRRVGAGQIIDRAMRRYVADLGSPDELARLLEGGGGAQK